MRETKRLTAEELAEYWTRPDALDGGEVANIFEHIAWQDSEIARLKAELRAAGERAKNVAEPQP